MVEPVPDALLEQAWAQCYLAPERAGAIGRRIAEAGGADAPWGWWHVALAEVRVGSVQAADEALRAARTGFAAAAAQRGLALADEVQAIALRRGGDAAAALALQETIDTREFGALERFISHNSRAITHKVLGQIDDALRHFLAGCDAAETSGNLGARITALANLGGYQQDLYNLDDAREMIERAFSAALEAGATRSAAAIATNLIVVHNALGDALRARETTAYLLRSADTLPPEALERHRTSIALGHVAVGEIDAAEALLARGPIGSVADNDGVTYWTWVSMRCALARGNPMQARELGQRTLRERAEQGRRDSPYDMMELERTLADANELLGDSAAALAHVRRAQALYEQLVGRSARARRIALEIGFDLARAQRERDHAIQSRERIAADRARLAELNSALEAKIAENEALHARLREQALRDPLTGLHNRRYLFEVGPGLLELVRRQNRPLAVVLVDLDHFKLLNDTYGHGAGDAVLQRFAALFAGSLRKSDVISRHGGEEFVALLPDVNGTGAQSMLDRLLQAYQSESHEHGRKRLPRCTFSAGIAEFPRHGSTLEQLLSRADRALYRAKQNGRARVEAVPGSAFGALV